MSEWEPKELALLDQARTSLDTARTVDEVKSIRDKAEAVRLYAKAQGKCLTIQNYAAEVKIRAERRAGELLSEMPKNEGAASQRGSTVEPRLGDLGISKKQSHRWQAVATVPEQKFEQHVAETKAAEKELTTASVLSLAKSIKNRTRNAEVVAAASSESDISVLVASGQKFSCTYADPPWRYGNQATRASTDNHYPTMTVDDIAALPVADLVTENAHLHLWTTNAFLFDCQRIMEAWGFTYKSCFVWVKPQMGIGNYWRVSHEFLLLGVRGSCPFLDKSQMSWLEARRSTHSTKPECVRQMIEKVSPGPRLELFARRNSPGWTTWGNQIERQLYDEAI